MSKYQIYLAVSFFLIIFVFLLWSAYKQKKDKLKKEMELQQFLYEKASNQES